MDTHCETPLVGNGQVSLSPAGAGSFATPLNTDINIHPGVFDIAINGSNSLSKTNYEIAALKVYIKVDFGDNHPWGKEQYQVDITDLNLSMQMGALGGGYNPVTLNPTPLTSLMLTQDNPEYVLALDLTDQLPAFAPNNATTTSIGLSLINNNSNRLGSVSIQPDIAVSNLGNGLTATDAQRVANNLRISLCYEVDYKISTTPSYDVTVYAPMQVQNTKRYQFVWSHAKASNDELWSPYYELQIVRLYNSKDHTPTSQEDIQTQVDWTRALSFVLPEAQLAKTTVNGLPVYTKELTLSEFTGYYAWRVRPIGSLQEGGVANNSNWGAWDMVASSALTQGTTVNLSQQSDLGSTAFTGSVFFFRDPDEAKERNTIYSRVFTEGGKTHEGMNYADGLLKSRQSQSYFPSNPTRKTVITQQFYDHVGRSSISTLPVPTQNELSGYQERFAQDATTQDLYTVDKFDQNNREDTPSPMTLKGAQPGETDYYSNDGPDSYVDNAQGFPFSISRYSNDGLDNVEQQSGVGKRHMIGDVNAGMGRTTRKNYTSDVSADELIRIFGAEAPDNETVTKEITTDPNGTESVSYIDKNGKLLATCLSYNSDLNSALTNLNGANTPFQVKDLMMASKLTNEGFVSSKRIFLSEDNNNLTIDYTPEGCNGFDVCGETLYCDFEVVFWVATVDNPTVNLVPAADQTRLISQICNVNTGVASVHSFSINLAQGDYIVKKILRAVDNGANGNSTIQAFIDSKIERTENTMQLYNTLVVNLLGNLTDDNAMDFATAMSCVETFVANAVALGPVTSPNASLQAYIATLETCLTDPSGLNFNMDNFDFSELERSDIDLTVVSNVSLNANGEIEINFDDCGLGIDDLTIDAQIEVLIPPCDGPAGGPYTYNGNLYDLPPFMESFIDNAFVGIRTQIIAELTELNNGTPPNNLDVRTAFDARINNNYMAYSNLNDLIVAIFPGYGITGVDVYDYLEGGSINDNVFNKMIWHMVNDRYYCGQLVWQEGDASTTAGYYTVDASGTLATTPFDFSPVTNSADVHVQYECKDLWKCWQANVQSILAILTLEPPAVTDLFAAMDDNRPNGGEDFNQHFEDNIPWLLRLFLGETNPVGAFQNDPAFAGGLSASDQTFDNLPALFLECTGYRFARIIDPRIVTDNAGTIIMGGAGVDHTTEYTNHLAGNSHPHQVGSAAQAGSALPTLAFNTLDMPLQGVDLQGTITVPTAIQNDMAFPTTGSSSSQNEINEYFNGRAAAPIDADKMPLIYNPVFAFKYYEYHHPQAGAVSLTEQAFTAYNNDPNNTSDPNFTPVTLPSFLASVDPPLHFRAVEIEMNYPYGGVNTTTLNPFCVTTRLTEVTGHDQWTCGYREEFRQGISNRQEMVINPANFDNPQDVFNNNSIDLANATDCNDAAALYADPNNNPMANSCKNACESRRAEFRAAIVMALEQRCYIIGGCTDCPGHIASADVEKLVDNLVTACQEQCAVNAATSPTSPCPNVQSCDVIYGTPCQKYLMEQVRSWRPEVDFESICDPNTPYPAGHLHNSFDPLNTGNSCDNTSTDFNNQPTTGPTSPVKIIPQQP